MKLNNLNIITLCDFRRNFDFSQFWSQRKHFIRDMHPDKVLYWNDEDKENYEKICEWIIKSESSGVVGTATGDFIATGLKLLSDYVGRSISDSDARRFFNIIDYNSDIIYIESGSERLVLPSCKYESQPEPSQNERLHKIEITGNQSGETPIFIGGKEQCRLKAGECIYVTEINGNYIRVLPNKSSKGYYHVSLVNIKGSFESDLNVVMNCFGREEEIIHAVTQFQFVHDTYKYSNSKTLIV